MQYRNYIIRYDPPPIPSRNHDWRWHHDEYDGALDALDPRSGTSASLEAAKTDIDALEAELEELR